ncbi:unnamed protein product [Alternaria alternata]
MSDKIIINGKSVAVDEQRLDASRVRLHSRFGQLGEPLNRAQKLELATLGVKIQEFVGQNGQQLYLCGFENDSLERVRKLSYIDYANVYSQDFVIPDGCCNRAPMSMLATRPTRARGASEQVEVDVLLHHDISRVTRELLEKIAEMAPDQASPIMVRIKAGAAALEQLAVARRSAGGTSSARESVVSTMLRGVSSGLKRYRSVSQPTTTTHRPDDGTSLRDMVGDEIADAMEKAQVKDSSSSGQTVCVCDTGFDMGSTADVHDGFLERVKGLYSWGRPGNNETNDPDGHGTHQFLGYPYATLYTDSATVRDTAAASIDKFVWDHQSMTILFAAGNEGQDTDLNGTVNERSLGAEASAKNCITIDLTVAKSNAPYSYGTFWPDRYARNPLKDDHLADNPEGYLSEYQDGGTPLVSGCCAVVRQALYNAGYEDVQEVINPLDKAVTELFSEQLGPYVPTIKNNPTASLIKALLINGAVPIRGQYMPEYLPKELPEGLPNPHSGFEQGWTCDTIDEEKGKAFLTLTLKVTMAYADLPGAALANDLNLVVVSILQNKERHGNQGPGKEFAKASKEGFDRDNNVEQVVWPDFQGVDESKRVVTGFGFLGPIGDLVTGAVTDAVKAAVGINPINQIIKMAQSAGLSAARGNHPRAGSHAGHQLKPIATASSAGL